ncbi:PREDICTED: potassium channel subfamily K member 18 [Thamnophis sirtalis]|uniref:Potassium channel subfamily K member 18 n=1 Tax=Thamnophis sirtalis TaxID=35019 RepID=A0A6I9Y5C2_9SAUR|nr:PREDICTED: potassium channel subfamily K member 18 [Thamnophis sirtalis]
MKSRTSPSQPKERTCCQVFWAIFPHACFICSLVVYALLGALMFSHVEGCRESHKDEAYRTFMLKLWNLSKDLSDNETNNEIFTNRTHELINQMDFSWFTDPSQNWSFLGSLFFCCTVFTTVGYGHIYPVTRLGKYLCMVYALFGIPLMFLVLTDMGDILATILSISYNRARKLQSEVLARLSFRSCCKKNTDSKGGSASLGAAKIVLLEPLNIKDVLKNNSSFKKKSRQNQNVEIFERLIIRENAFLAPPKLTRSERWNSCPELDKGAMVNHVISNINNLGKKVDKLDVPFSLMIFIVFAYISCAAAILPHWESDLDFEEAFYFCFITLTTIGFGDIKLQHPNFFLFFSVYIIVGIEIVIIAFKLGQDRILGLYKKLLLSVGRKKVSDKTT